jgi:hypothetical protein
MEGTSKGFLLSLWRKISAPSGNTFSYSTPEGLGVRLLSLLGYRINNKQLKVTLLLPRSQGGNCLPNCLFFSAKSNDFHLNYCILKENTKNTTSGSTKQTQRSPIFQNEAGSRKWELHLLLFNPR